MKRAILIVPGLGKREQNGTRDLLAQSLQFYADGFSVVPNSDDEGGAPSGCVRLQGRARSEDRPDMTLDIYEAYWGDMIPDLSNENPITRFFRATRLIGYWFLGGLFRAMFRIFSPARPAQMTVALFVAGLLLLLWYLTVVSAVAVALAAGESAIGTQIVGWIVAVMNFFTWVFSGFSDQAEAMDVDSFLTWLAGLKDFWLIPVVIGLFGVGWLERASNLSDFFKTYLRDDPVGDSPMGIRARTKHRVVLALDDILASDQNYDDVLVIGHSLGGAIAVDSVAEYGKSLTKMDLLTWGTMLGPLSEQEPILKQELNKLGTTQHQLRTWKDFAFRSDVLAAPVPDIDTDRENFPQRFTPSVAWGSAFSQRRTHQSYYRNETVVLELLSLPAAPVSPADPVADAAS